MSLEELVGEADEIHVGRILSSECRWNDDRSAIYTYHRMLVERTLKGTPDRVVEIRVLGGEIREEDVRLSVSHQPEIAPGDEGIVFVDNDPELWTSIVGSSQGFLKFEHEGPDRRVVADGFGRPIWNLADNNRFLSVHDGPRLNDRDLIRKIDRIAR